MFYSKIFFCLLIMSLLSLVSGLLMGFWESCYLIEMVLGGQANTFSLTLLLDQMAFLFMSVVFFISMNVVFYSKSYMAEDPHKNRFILIVFAFIVSMALLILSPNIITILLGWDGLGLVSYCLVIYYPSKKSSSAGMLTVMSNRVGDICILFTIAYFGFIGDFMFLTWISPTDSYGSTLLGFLIISAAITKSAQFPFSAWLPAAMAAPTPVSALVHSSTLVTAGVYLLIRFSESFSSETSSILLALSSVTMFLSGLVAMFEYDLKKIIALSTLSQLGVMMFSISVGLYTVAFFHLLTHALFKALLFLSAGALIHGVGGSQDLRMCGGLVKNFPLVGACMNLANLSLCGIPFLSGFYSKDLIVELTAQGTYSQFILIILFISLGLTVMYSLRLVYMSFVSSPQGSPSSFVCDNDSTMNLPICALTACALLSGPSLSWLLFPFPTLISLPYSLKLLTLIIIALAFISSLFMNTQLISKSQSLFTSFKPFMGSMMFLPFISGQMTTSSTLTLSDKILKQGELGWMESWTSKYLASTTQKSSSVSFFIQSNSLKIHFFTFFIWASLLMLALY
uniref:NADH-ubiquinone oxidoreductase chain 5 n=1 Tax=Polyphemus pediculus TaxID=77662 RepID=A0A7L7S124_9CRUS|nr:NADH dehydrogenase subunit 5 [Polyphemus pediculus]